MWFYRRILGSFSVLVCVLCVCVCACVLACDEPFTIRLQNILRPDRVVHVSSSVIESGLCFTPTGSVKKLKLD